MKTRRQSRYKRLREGGFCAFESSELSRMPLSIPYWKAMRKTRKERLVKYLLTEKASRYKFEKMIRQEYIDRKWLKRTKAGSVMASPWLMLKDFEARFKAKFPDYESPWEKRRKAWKDFRAKLEATYAKYPAGRAYKKKEEPVRYIEYLPSGGARFVE